MTRLNSRADRLRLPCFAFDAPSNRLVLPAFGQLTGGHDCGNGYAQWVVADGAIVPWFIPSAQHQERIAA